MSTPTITLITVDSLREQAKLASETYHALLARFPNGQACKARDEAHSLLEALITCAVALQSRGGGGVLHIGPFSTIAYSRKQRVRVRAGAICYGTGMPENGKVLARSQTVVIRDIFEGYVAKAGEGQAKIHDPEICWIGSGGYLRYVSLNDIEPE